MTRNLAILCVLLAASLPGAADEQPVTIQSLLDAKALETDSNFELLDYLIEEGRDTLPADQRQAALDQLVVGLKADVDITPDEQKAAAMAAAGAGLAQLFGGADGAEYGGVAQDATWQIWSGWVDSAFVLQRAGYSAESQAFFTKCVEVFPYSDLRGRCAIGLALADPQGAYDRVMALTEAVDNETKKAVLPLLGELAGAEGFPDELRGEAVTRLTEFTTGMQKATFGSAACRGLVATGDPRAVPTLQKLSSGMMNTEFYSCARSGLLLTFDDRSVVPLLEKDLGGGMFSSVTPADRLRSASLLMRAGEASGFAFAEAELTKKQKKGLSKFMQPDSEDVDIRPALVTALVRAGGDDAVRVLKTAMASVEKGSWLETWIAVGLLELGDTSEIDLARAALSNPEWAFTTVRISTALAKNGDYSGIPALGSLYSSAARGVEPDWGKAAIAYLAGEGAEYDSSEKAKRARLIRLRHQIASALADIDQPDCVQILTEILDDSEPAVRASAAYALARMSTPEAATGLVAALGTDYGTFEGRSRNPVIHAHAVRGAAAHHAGSDGWGLVASAAHSNLSPSVRFLCLCADGPTEGPAGDPAT